MIVLVNFSDDSMRKAQALCSLSAQKNGVDVVWEQNPNTISQEFKEMNEEILSQPRGAGYWLWKPYFIYKSLLKLNEGDVLIYADAGVEFIAPVNEVVSRMDEDIFFFTNGWPHMEWCKADVAQTILPSVFNHHTQYFDYCAKHSGVHKQIQASVIFFKVNQKTRDFVKEWLLYCQMPGFITDSPSRTPNYPTFAEHRHDQAILTTLAIKHGLTMNHWWPTTYSMHLERKERDSYPVLFNHHRRRDNEWQQ